MIFGIHTVKLDIFTLNILKVNLESEFLAFINKNQLFSKQDKLLLALSGGKDSVALFHLLKKNSFDFEVAHCNFRLRAEASDADENFVKELCGADIICHVKPFDTIGYAKINQLSTQMAARDLRYAWFKNLIQERNLDFLLTAHHLNDRIETLLFNLTKGTGPKGILGIPLKSNLLRRPLLFCSSSKIDSYLKENSFSWREDSSNAETKYSRNKIRHRVIPELKIINPGLEDTLKVNFERLGQWYDIFQTQLDIFKSKATLQGFEINYLQSTPGAKLLLEEYLKPYGFTYQQVSAIFEGFTAGKIYLTDFYQVFVGRTHVKLAEINDSEDTLVLNDPGEYTVNNQLFSLKLLTEKPRLAELKNQSNAYIDHADIVWPLTIRTWEKGDTFKPFGMKGIKLISDYLIDNKVDMSEKARQLVVCDQEKILWLVGLRTSELAKIKENTVQILHITTTF
jgi:tRNA(Ile)-lysidine synthase